MIVNFAVKEAGLEAQLLAAVVRSERPDLDGQKNDLVVKVAAGKRTQAELEDTILQVRQGQGQPTRAGCMLHSTWQTGFQVLDDCPVVEQQPSLQWLCLKIRSSWK